MRHTAFVLILVPFIGSVLQGCVKDEPFKPSAPPPAAEQPLPPEPARSKTPIEADATYNLVSVQSGKCVQFADGADGARAHIATCDGRPAQGFKLEALPDGYHRIRSATTQKCLDISGVSRDDGAAALQWTCGDGHNQQWIIADAGPDAIRLIARHSGKALDIFNEQTKDGTPLLQWTWKGSPNQQFRLKKADHATAAAIGGPGGADGKAAAPGKEAPAKGHGAPSAKAEKAEKAKPGKPAAVPAPAP
jgi:hypothetical protein